MKKKVTVTIGREYGSGGREVGEKLAEKLGFTFLDKNILNEISGKSGFSVEELMENDEKPSSPFRESFIPYDFDADTLSERLFDMQADLILNCIFTTAAAWEKFFPVSIRRSRPA